MRIIARYGLALHYEDVVDQMFIQLDGLSFVERAFQELRTKCHKAAYWSNSNAGYDRKGDTLRFGGYFAVAMNDGAVKSGDLQSVCRTFLPL